MFSEIDGLFQDPSGKFRTLLDAIPVAIFVKDAGSRIVFGNRATEPLFGMDRTEVVGTHASRLIPENQWAFIQEKDREAFSSGEGIEYEFPVWHAGQQRNLMVRTHKRAWRPGNRQSDFLLCVSIDVTARQEVEAALRVSEEKLRGLFELSRLGIALTDMQGHYIEFNEAFRRICGYTRDELNTLDYWALTPREYEAQEAEQIEALRRHGSYGPYEKEYIRKDGTRIPLRLDGLLVHGSDGKPYIWSIVEDISERKEKDARIWKQANFDALTELPNRRLFHDRIEQETKKAHRTGVPLALLFIDLDHFKDINDALGHAKGDRLLVEAARRIRQCVRETDTLARLGGDEFTVILPELHAPADVERVAHAILETLAQPFDLGAEQGYVTASIGITIYPDDAGDVESLLRHADQAMYQAKALGRNRYAYFTLAMQQRAEQKLMLGNDLHHALANGDMCLYYQPIISLATGQVKQVEALLRWRHPLRGLIEPLEFIPLAEESGLIQQIGHWVLDEAALAARRLHDEDISPIQISINKSPLEFLKSAGEMDWVGRLLSHGLPASSFMVEITEQVLTDDSPAIRQRLHRIQEAGIDVAIDDFGTGLSSLTCLKRFHVDCLKIDRSFVRDLVGTAGESAIVEAVIAMAHKLGIRVIAEGVETVAQRDALRAMGCDYAQGFLFSPAVPMDDLCRWLRHPDRTLWNPAAIRGQAG